MNDQGSGIRGQGSGSFAEPQSSPEQFRWIGIAVILVAAIIAIAPQLYLGNSCGHDFDFHLVSWLDAQQGWRQGIFYPHWSPSANFGAGEPRFVFYPPVSWMLGAALGFVLPWKWVSVAMTWMFLAGTGLATRALARQMLSEGPATLAGCAALFSGYALFTAYERSDFGELAGGFWIPLLLLFTLRDKLPDTPGWRRAFDGSAAPLALALAGAWLSNAPLGVMASYLLAAFAIAVAVLRRSGAPLLRAAVAAVLGLGFAAFYLVPATVEQRWVDIAQAVDDPGYQVENSWLFAHHADPSLELHDLELLKASAIAATMLAVAISGIFVCWARHRFRGKSRWWIPLALIPFAVLFLQFPLSGALWKVIPELRFLQFPWRWLVVAEAPMGIFFASAVWITRRRPWRIVVLSICAAVFLVATGAAAFSFFQDCDEEDAVAGMLNVYRAGTGFEGSDEYAPLGADNSLVASGLPAACLSASAATPLGQAASESNPAWNAAQGSCAGTFAFTRDKINSEHLEVDADAAHEGFLILRLRSYPAWDVRVNGKPVYEGLPRRADGLIAVPVRQGHALVTVDWTTTRDAWIGRLLSTLAGLLVTALWAAERWQLHPRLS